MLEAPPLVSLSAHELRRKWGDALDLLSGADPVVLEITRHGRPAFYCLSRADYERYAAFLAISTTPSLTPKRSG